MEQLEKDPRRTTGWAAKIIIVIAITIAVLSIALLGCHSGYKCRVGYYSNSYGGGNRVY